MTQTQFQLKPGAARYQGTLDRYVRFTMDHQLMNEKTWDNFVRVFLADSDDWDKGWRGEYWGKMMRGACLTYRYNGDEDLYRVLEHTVRQMLQTQRPDGRFSTYSKEKQLNGWDVWGRKYVTTAMLHFYDICKDEALKEAILSALCNHIDALIADVGSGENQVEITRTSAMWGGVASASILDAVIDLYRHTGKETYREFAQYIISTGGCVDDNLIELALEDKVMPYEYPVVKAYELMSFFEGVLSYYEITGEEKYLQAVLNFVEAVNRTDITAIGCSGCTHELFDHSAVMQVVYSEGIMQETCDTVTWMRLLSKLFAMTGEEKYIARMEQSAYNALYGSVNTQMLQQYSREEKRLVEPLPFDSYSPLYNQTRGVGIGGFKRFTFGGYYGCCACIAAAGIAVFPLCATTKSEEGISFNTLTSGVIETTTPAGAALTITMQTQFPAKAEWNAKLSLAGSEEFVMAVRIPEYMENIKMSVNGAEVPADAKNGYICVESNWTDGDCITLNAELSLRVHRLEDKAAVTYGPLVLCRDSEKEDGADVASAVALCDNMAFRMEETKAGELVRIYAKAADGQEVLLTDYASCGKNWLGKHNRITVWMNLA